MDGLKLYLEQASDSIIQNRHYNGWMHDHYVSTVLVLCPDGTIPIVTYNIPGCFLDSTITEWGNIYQKLRGVHSGGKCTLNSDSARSAMNF